MDPVWAVDEHNRPGSLIAIFNRTTGHTFCFAESMPDALIVVNLLNQRNRCEMERMGCTAPCNPNGD